MAMAFRGRVLLVDADPGARGAHARVLGEAGFEVQAAPTSSEAGALLLRERFDAVLGDGAVAGEGGSELLRVIREHDRDLPVILMAEASSAASRPATARGAVEVLAKPVAPGALRRATERAVRRGHGWRSLTSYRNRRGEEVEVSTFGATEAKNEFGRVLQEAANQGIVVITRHDQPEAIVLSIDEFKELAGARERKLEALGAEFDALLARMQAPAARAGVKAAFDATPARMGEAAVQAARKRG
jgi:prevent-host-death family protein